MNKKYFSALAAFARHEGFPEGVARAVKATPELKACLEDVLEWMETGKVDGVGFDLPQVEEAIRAALKGLTP